MSAGVGARNRTNRRTQGAPDDYGSTTAEERNNRPDEGVTTRGLFKGRKDRERDENNNGNDTAGAGRQRPNQSSVIPPSTSDAAIMVEPNTNVSIGARGVPPDAGSGAPKKII